jgi:hypothetical protein
MDLIDIDLTYRAARSRWLKESAPRRAMADWFALFTPWSIVIVFAAAYALSAPHTAAVMDRVTPGMGFIAPIAVEFALIWASFEIRRARSADSPPLPAARFLRWFMLVIAVATNAAGGMSAVVAGTGVTELSATALYNAFEMLPLITQVALLMVIVAALAVPITAEATGGAIAQLVFERRSRDDFREQAWQGVAFEQTARAAFVHFSRAGHNPEDARKLAVGAVRGYLNAGAGRGGAVRSPQTEQTSHLLTIGQMGQTEQTNGQTANGRGQVVGAKLDAARAYLTVRPELHALSVSAVWEQMTRDGVQVGRDTAYKALQQIRSEVQL